LARTVIMKACLHATSGSVVATVRASLRVVAKCAVGALVGVVVDAAHAIGPGDTACPEDDRLRLFSQLDEANAAMEAQRVDRFQALTEKMVADVSPVCRGEFERLVPGRNRCSPSERRIAMEGLSAMYRSFARAVGLEGTGDLMGAADAYIQALNGFLLIEQRVTHPCWIALNVHTDGSIVRSCSESELTPLAELAAPLYRASVRVFQWMDPTALETVRAQTPALSAECSAAISRFVPRQILPDRSDFRPNVTPPPAVRDHGNGVISVPGAGACGATGCVAF
jgi:hypothetical protein